jgi:hypothetical protein
MLALVSSRFEPEACGAMEKSDPEFLPTMVGILKRLQMTSEERGFQMIACFLDLARAEAEEELKHIGERAALAALMVETSSRTTWRAGAEAFGPADAANEETGENLELQEVLAADAA